MNSKVKQILTHAGMVVAMIIVSCIYFSPALSGKAIVQGDIQKADAMSYEQRQVGSQTGDIPNWNSSMFGGMPGYQTAMNPQKSVFTPLKSMLIMRPMGAERHIGVLFLYLLGFYVALMAFGLSPWLAALGSIAFGLGSYNIIIIEAGHITKAWAMSMIAPVLAGMVLTLKGARTLKSDSRAGWGKIIWGAILFTFALGLQITFNHIQITYYTAIGGVVLGLVYTVFSVKDKWFKGFLTAVGILAAGCALAMACNARNLMVNQEYAKETMRGGSDLTDAKGLDQNYAFSWSYGVGETYTILVPGAYGGGSGEKVGSDSEFYKNFHQDVAPLYWGNQPFTSGPVYFGAIVVFLFVLGLLVVKGPERWWLLIATIIAIIMSWGGNFEGFNAFLFDNLPLYNKFRTPSMSLVLANVTMVILGMLAIEEIFTNNRKNNIVMILVSAGITCLVILVGLVMSSSLSFSGASDAQMAQAYGNQWPYIQDIIIKDRESLFRGDSLRSIIFILLSAAVLCLYASGNNKKPKQTFIPLGILIVLMIVDLAGVDGRYLSKDNYVAKSKLELHPEMYDLTIDQMAAQNGDKDYRVLTLATNTFNDSKPSAFHHQIGGYSAAKLSRYQDLIDSNFNGQLNFSVLSMLNTRYIVGQDGRVDRLPFKSMGPNGEIVEMYAPMGNAWFVDNFEMTDSPKSELQAISSRTFEPAKVAYVDKCWEKDLDGFVPQYDSLASIEMVHTEPYLPDHLTYTSNSSKDQLAVFSEIYYAPDWRAYIDGKPARYFRADYVLRAMIVPAGEHKIEFVNEAPSAHKWDTVSLISSIVLILGTAGVLVLYYRRKRTTEESK